jgi:hypothetical protein
MIKIVRISNKPEQIKYIFLGRALLNVASDLLYHFQNELPYLFKLLFH